MRKYAVVLIVALVVMCTACRSGDSTQSNNTVAPWTPQNEESKQLVKMLITNKTGSIISYKVDDSIKNVKLGCQYYEKGRLITDTEHGGSALMAEGKVSQGLISIVRDEKEFELSASCNGNSFSISDIEIPGYKARDNDYSFVVVELTEEVSFTEGEPVYLVAYYNNEDGETHAYDPQSLLDDPELLKSNEKTWIIYAVFSNIELE